MIKRGSEEFSGYNKPKKTPNHPTKSHAVLAKSGDEVKLIRFGQQGVKGSPDGTKRNEAFKARHAENIAKGKMSAAFWANKVKWGDYGTTRMATRPSPYSGGSRYWFGNSEWSTGNPARKPKISGLTETGIC